MKYFKLLASFLLAFTFIACGGGSSDSSEAKQEKASSDDVKGVNKVQVLGSRNVKLGKSSAQFVIAYATYDENGTFIEKEFSSDDVAIKNLKVKKESSDSSRSVKPKASASILSNKLVNNSSKEKYIAVDIDSSGSMMDTDSEDKRKDAAKKFIDIANGGNSKISVIDFDDDVEILTGYTSDTQVLKDAVDTIDSMGTTFMYTSLIDIIAQLKNKNGSRNIVLLTDGDASDLVDWSNFDWSKIGNINPSDYDKMLDEIMKGNGGDNNHSKVIKQSKENDITIYAIALGDQITRFENLKELADKTNGIFVKIQDPNGLEKIYNNFAVDTMQGSQNTTVKVDYGETFNEGDEVSIEFDFVLNNMIEHIVIKDTIK
ncbi:MAG: VWA domain-containing protein [Arcobacter sp.]|nr:VWA domain-containing protein [Arcobacter sp.]